MKVNLQTQEFKARAHDIFAGQKASAVDLNTAMLIRRPKSALA